MPAGFTENHLVEQPALRLFEELGWVVVSAMDEVFGSNGTLGRETKSEVVLVPKLHATLERLNPTLPSDAINSAIDELVLGLPLPPLLSGLIGLLKAKDIAK